MSISAALVLCWLAICRSAISTLVIGLNMFETEFGGLAAWIKLAAWSWVSRAGLGLVQLNCVMELRGALTLVYLPGKEMLNVVLLEEGNDEKDF